MYGQQEPVGMTIASTYNLAMEQDFYITCVTGFFLGNLLAYTIYLNYA
jgi:hypothetical protein